MSENTLSIEALAALKAVAASQPPNWVRPLSAYSNGWPQAIGAHIIARDEYGPTVVSWCGHIYTRRCGNNKQYGAAIWFSRAAGKNESGENNYARLITFKEKAVPHAEPLPEYVIKKLTSNAD
ncbi:single-stranded DNA-binding protein [Leptothoe sp. PORK10 BA2]|uniref:single-stranded DNA-binding protein n=1 Tax=Leptothoe sp. PORK10 BA2 TaxID=3110254 RepID=UPI002B1F5911|nr:single-stranded DNA-binding protein [Leptothoe sp. PORK10 BA2]MEA5465292.1 single-stranded DNA-binding protein [Leptothoe sp. PORK10 BA2]